MRFTQDSPSNVNVVRGYAPGELRINDAVFRDSVIIAAGTLRAEPAIVALADFAADHVTRLLELDPEVVLVGTGAAQVFPAASLSAQFLRLGIGFEVMDTGAACRTFNVLVGEQRRVVALLIV